MSITLRTRSRPALPGLAVSALAVSALAVSALALSGCVVGPDFRAPAAPQAARYSATPLASLLQSGELRADPALPVPAEWWSLLGSAKLDATIRTALGGNLSLQAARQRLAQADEAVGVAEAGLFPRIDADATAGHVKYGPAFLGPQKLPGFSFYSVGPSISYAFDYTGGQRRTVEEQRALADSQQQQLQAAALALSGNVAMQALLLASAQAQLDSLQAVLADDRRNLQLVQMSFAAGQGTRVDVLNAQSQLANDETLLPPLRRAQSLSRDALALLVGQAPGQWQPPAFTLADFRLPARVPLSVPSELAHRRPDILAAEASLHAATAAVGVATADLYPRISLTANASFQANVLQKLFNASGIGYGLTGNLTAPLFNHGALRARQRAARDAARAALADYRQAVLRAFGQVADALEELDHDAELLSAEQAAVQTAAESLALTRESYSAGNSGVLQVLDAQRQDEQARLGLVRAQAQRLQDAAQLLLAIGGPLPADELRSASSPAPARR